MTRQELITYCLTFGGSFEDNPFDDVSKAGAWTVISHESNKKPFALIYERNGKLCVNLKSDQFEAEFLRRAHKDITPGWNMNKKNWNTVTLGGDVPEDELKFMIKRSYDLITAKKKRI
jgi:predicted DNA-binding protein (MmcQ/YjbR family)